MSVREGLSVKQEAFLAALLVEPTVNKAAALARISEATATRYRQDPAFTAAYHQARQQQIDEAIALLSAHTGQAIETLIRNLNCGAPAVECRAAAAILRQVLATKMEVTGSAGRQIKLTEIVVQLPQAEGSGQCAVGSAGPAIQGEPVRQYQGAELPPGLVRNGEGKVVREAAPDSAWGSLEVVVEPSWRMNDE